MKNFIFKFIYLFFAVCIISINNIHSQVNSRIVNIETAKKVGLNFFHNVLNSETSKNVQDLILLKKYSANNNLYTSIINNDTTNYIYIFETKPNNGFIIISADNTIDPILGYSDKNKFVIDKMPDHIIEVFDNYISQIKYIKENNIIANDNVKSMWDALENQVIIVTDTNTNRRQSYSTDKKTFSLPSSVAPLIRTKWNQSPLYNLNCPPYKDTYANPNESNTVAGCVAIATAQVMNYWGYPAKGVGFKTYMDENGADNNGQWTGQVQANFAATTYNWSEMTIRINSTSPYSAIKAISTLVGNVGVATGMDYNYSGSSTGIAEAGAQRSAEYALKKFFNYDSTSIRAISKDDYTDANWIDTLRNELSQGRPIIYAGLSPDRKAGHCFVLDGYDSYTLTNATTTYKFDINWGWGGSCDGFYNLNSLIPTTGALGSGSGDGNYNAMQHALIGVKPPSTFVDYTFVMAANLNPTPANAIINYGNQLTIATNVKNTSNVTFNGDYAIFIFDSTLSFVDTLNLISNRTLPPNNVYTNNLTFTNNGLFRMLPGKYIAAIYFKPNGQGWQLVGNSSSFNNYIEIKVINTNIIELNSAISTLQTAPYKIGDSLNVTLNVKNTSTTKYFGQYQLALYTLDGLGVQQIGKIITDTTNGLPPNYTYGSPFLKFNSLLNITPGDYLLALTHIPKGGTSELVGSTSFKNPIRVSINSSGLIFDKYENNDSLKVAYNINNTFNKDSLFFSSDSSNIHNGEDIDYYKIVLKDGYSYSINMNVFDAIYKADNKRYSLSSSVLFYSTDGSTWSKGYYNKLPNRFSINGADTLYIFVGPKYVGMSGNYLLNVDIKRTCILPPTPTIKSFNNIKNICEGSALILNSSSNTGNEWYLNGTLKQNSTYASDTVKISGNYSVIVNNGICKSAPSDPFTVTVNPLPNSPILRDTFYCVNANSDTLRPKTITGATFLWYGTNATGGTASITAIKPSTTTAGTVNYYVSQLTTATGCESPRSKISVTINPLPTAPIVTNLSYCIGTTASTLSATAIAGNTLNWYGTSATGGNANLSAPTPSTTTAGTFNYYVSQLSTSTGCESPRSNLGVTINSLPSAPIVSNLSYCIGAASSSLSATAITGNTLNWYGTSATGGIASKTAPIPSTTAVGTFNYYVSQLSSGCESPRSNLVISVLNTPTAPVLSRDVNNFLVSNVNGITWYKDGAQMPDTTQKLKPSVAGLYTAKTSQNGCSSALSAPYYYLVTDIINLSADEFIQLAPNPFINKLNFNFVIKGYQKLNIEVFDIATGIRKSSIQNLTNGMQIYLGQLSAGTYYVRVSSKDGKINYQFKMIKL
jgi:hypothetical protein